MKLIALCAVLVLCCGAAQASIVSELVANALEFAQDTLTAPDAIGVTGDGDSLTFERKWDAAGIPGLKDLDLYAGLGCATEGLGVRGVISLTLTNVKGTALAVGIRTTSAEDGTWVIDEAWLPTIGLEPVLELRRAF